MINNILIYCIFLILFSNVCYSEPVISSAAINGASINISGTQFGTKAIAQPIKFDTFNDGTIGAYIETGGYWTRRAYNTAKYDNSIQQRDLTGKCIKSDYTGLSDEWFYKTNVGFATTGKAFVSLWVYCDYVSGDGPTTYWMQKIGRLNYDGNDHTSRPLIGFTAILPDGNPINENYIQFAGNRSDGVGFPEELGTVHNNNEKTWVNITIQYKTSDIDIANGYIKTCISRTDGTSIYSKENQNLLVRTTGYTQDINSIALGYLLEVGGTEAYTYWDDIYIDNSWARVEIGDNATYSNCTHREIQPALTWSDTGITGTFNQGSFNAGDTVYVFVVDENGIASAGYAVVLGSEPAVADPVVEILTASGQTTTASVFTITGTATADTGQTISGVTCSGQTVPPDDGVWDEQAESFTCLASLALGETTLVFVGSDGTRTGQDSITVTRIKKTSKINGSATIKNATIHQ